MYGHRDLGGYMDGSVFGTFNGMSAAKAIGQDVVGGLVAVGLAWAEGQVVTEELQKDASGAIVKDAAGKPVKTGAKTYGSEIKLGGKVPVNFVAALGLHALGFAADDYVDPEWFHAAAIGAVSVWSTNRGHEMGMKWRKDKEAAAAKKASGGAAPRGLRERTQVAQGAPAAAPQHAGGNPWR